MRKKESGLKWVPDWLSFKSSFFVCSIVSKNSFLTNFLVLSQLAKAKSLIRNGRGQFGVKISNILTSTSLFSVSYFFSTQNDMLLSPKSLSFGVKTWNLLGRMLLHDFSARGCFSGFEVAFREERRLGVRSCLLFSLL